MTRKQLHWIIKKAGDAMVVGGDLETNLVANDLRVAAEHLLVLQNKVT